MNPNNTNKSDDDEIAKELQQIFGKVADDMMFLDAIGKIDLSKPIRSLFSNMDKIEDFDV